MKINIPYLPSPYGVAKRPSGSEWHAGGMPEPLGDRAAARGGSARFTEALRRMRSSASFACAKSRSGDNMIPRNNSPHRAFSREGETKRGRQPWEK